LTSCSTGKAVICKIDWKTIRFSVSKQYIGHFLFLVVVNLTHKAMPFYISIKWKTLNYTVLHGMGYIFEHNFQQCLNCIVTVSFIGRWNESTRRKPPICRKSLPIFIT
jgi:hypothetical protein